MQLMYRTAWFSKSDSSIGVPPKLWNSFVFVVVLLELIQKHIPQLSNSNLLDGAFVWDV